MFQFARATQLFCCPTVVGGTTKSGVAHAFVEVAATVLFQGGPHVLQYGVFIRCGRSGRVGPNSRLARR